VGWQRTASVALVSATAASFATSAFWIARGTGGVSLRPPARAPAAPVKVDDPPSFRAPGALLTVPVAGIRPDELFDTFSQARDDGARPHDAIDIPAPAGTPVLAAAAGRLDKLFTSDAGGLTLYVRSPDQRVEMYYAHLNDYAPGLRAGQAIRRGQRLGSVGASGNANPDSPHLHFAVSRVMPGESPHAGRPVNPYPLLTGTR